MEKNSTTNTRIREALKQYGVTRWKLADALGVSEMYVYRALRHELPKEEQERYIQLIRQKAEEKK